MEPARQLLIVPIIHSAADGGTLAARSPRTVRQRIEFERKQNLIQTAWQEIEQNLLRWRTDFSNIFVYQDGLPADDEREFEVIQKVAAAGSFNFALLLKLRSFGAQIIGTESPDLLERELRLQQQILASPNNRTLIAEMSKVLQERDEFIARRIEKTLPAGKTGILFVGLRHQIENYLPKSIEILKGKLK